ncbi:hypothetical protein C8Q76DRAFT_166947 [Earliella scabrosa]|nr:hypothetical protein C8Q76DRAFT_166947 [Earliella scabrosa]
MWANAHHGGCRRTTTSAPRAFSPTSPFHQCHIGSPEKAPHEDGDVDRAADRAFTSSEVEVVNRARGDGGDALPPTSAEAPREDVMPAQHSAAFIPVLSLEMLVPPKLPTQEQANGGIPSELRKRF